MKLEIAEEKLNDIDLEGFLGRSDYRKVVPLLKLYDRPELIE